MADYNTSFVYLMGFEDSHPFPGKVTTDAGGRTRFGIAERWYKSMVPDNFYTTMPTADAFMFASKFYKDQYWTKFQGDGISSQPLADHMMSWSVNLGLIRVVKWAQSCVDVNIAQDG